MINQKKTIILLGFAGTLFVVLLAFYAYFFVAMQGKNARAMDAVVRVKSLEGEEQNLSQNARALKEYSEAISKLESYVVRESGAVKFTQEIESLGTKAGVQVKLESLEQVNPTKETVALSVRLKGEGSFAGVMKFMGMLENFPARFDFTSVRVFQNEDSASGAKEKASGWTIAVGFQVLSYSRE